MRNPGRCNRVVYVQAATKGQAANGQETRTWANVGTLTMDVEEVSARERRAAEQTVAEVEGTFRCQPGPGADLFPDTHRFIYRDAVWSIEGRRELGSGEGFEFACIRRGEEAYKL